MNLLIYGIKGYMGRTIEELAREDVYWNRVQGLSREQLEISKDVNYNVLIDFTHESSLEDVLKLGLEKKLPLIIGTTGYDEEQLNKIKDASKIIPILHATNMSLGMNLLFNLVEETARILKDRVDIEVVESHHNRKKDAPSGSAVTIVESIEKGLGESRKHQHGRNGECPRENGEIGIHALRGGNIVGSHEVSFINHLETIKISHEAHDRKVFAQGALEAARFIMEKKPGLYNMKDVLNV